VNSVTTKVYSCSRTYGKYDAAGGSGEIGADILATPHLQHGCHCRDGESASKSECLSAMQSLELILTADSSVQQFSPHFSAVPSCKPLLEVLRF